MKLQACGIGGNLHKLLTSYLQNRKQFVEINGKSSDSCEVKYGVPQGSLLDPRLYGIQAADLPEVPSEGVLEMFADDTEYYYIGNSLDEITLIIQKSLNETNEWCMKNFLSIHRDKTEVIIISSRNIVGTFQPIRLEDHIVKFVTESECLGMIVDNRLSWCSQVKNASSNLNKKIKQLKRMKSLPSKVYIRVYIFLWYSSQLHLRNCSLAIVLSSLDGGA